MRLKQACLIDSQRAVSLDVFYHMPDNPHVLRDFVWQTEDEFVATKTITDQLDQTARAFISASSLTQEALDSTVEFLADNIKSMRDHALRMKNTDDHFEIPFHDRGGPTLLDRLAAKLSYKLLVCVMPPRLFFAPVFVHSVAGRSPRPEEQNLVYYRPHLAFVH
jgi:uncharacterized protein Usg